MLNPIAFFCAEYALDPQLPIYAGGLGILAADFLREAAALRVPMVGLGLFYDFNNIQKLEKVPIVVSVPIQNKQIKVQVFVYKVGSVPVYLLNTNLNENDQDDRRITEKLYVADKEMRLKQELVLGIGGARVMRALNITPRLYHLNEGHSAFLALEVIHQEMAANSLGFSESVGRARKKIVFTNHTLLAIGREVYNCDLVSLQLSGYAAELGIPLLDIIQLGQIPQSSEFSMTLLSLNTSEKVNAVSKLHAQKAADIWPDHPMIPITNGIGLESWDVVKSLDEHRSRKTRLLSYIHSQTGEVWDPNHLLIGWARRFVEYKRPLAILDDLERYLSIASNSNFPVRLVFAGQPHENDSIGGQMVAKLQNLIKTKLNGLVVYLPDYNLDLAKQLVSGCDVWLNTPIVGFEACGTSGMKAALNGVLPCSTPDGWMAEVDIQSMGWVLDSERLTGSIHDNLQQNIVSAYYQNQKEWLIKMKNSRETVQKGFGTNRMLREYMEKLYN